MSQFLARRWRQQPQGVVLVDWSNPLARGILFAQIGGQLQEAVFNSAGTTIGSIAPRVDRYGSGLGLAGTGAVSYPNQAKYFPATNLSILSIFRPANGQANNTTGNIFGRPATGGIAFGLQFTVSNFSTNGINFRVRNSGGFSYGGGIGLGDNFNWTRPYIISGSAGTTTATKLYQEGILKNSGGTLNDSFYTGGGLGLAIGSGDGTTASFNGSTFLNVLWNRVLSDAEHYEIGNNPWQIFVPLKTVSYSLPAVLYTAIDETVSDRSDYIQSSVAGQVYETTLSPIAQPTGNIDINFEADSPDDAGSIKFDVLSGPTTVKSQTVSLMRNWAGRIRSPQLRQQPQGNAQIDWGNPIARGLIGAWTGSSPNLNLATGAIISTASTPVPPYLASGRNGLEYAAPISGSAVELLPANKTPTGQACVTLLYRKRDITNRTSTAFGSTATNSDRFQAHLPWSDGVVYFDYGGTNGINRVSVAGLTYGNDVWSFNNSTAGLQIWQNGVLRASNSSASPTRTPGRLAMFSGGTDTSDAANTAVFLVHDRSLTPSEIVSLSNNPWQLFRPPTRAVSYVRPLDNKISITPADYSVIDTPRVGRFLPQRWRQQPQGNAQIDWSNPLSNSLQHVYSAPIGMFIPAKSALTTSTSVRPRVATGNFLSTGFSGGEYTRVQTTTPPNTGWTIAAVITLTAYPASTQSTLIGHADGGRGSWDRSILINSAGKFGGYLYDGSERFIYSSVTAQLNVPYRVVVWYSGNSINIAVNSVAQQNTLGSLANGGWPNYGTNIYFYGGKSSGNAWPDPPLHYTALALKSDTAWDLSTRQAFFDNPWQIFKANTGRMYGLPPAGGWPWSPKLRITSL